MAPIVEASQSIPNRAGETDLDVSVHVVVFGHLSARAMARAREEVDRVWTPLHVQIHWDVSSPVRDVPQGEQPDVTILIEDAVPIADRSRPSPPLARGTLRLSSNGPGTAVIVIAIDQVRNLVEGMDRYGLTVDSLVPIVLGRALAHELGHYLLGSAVHAPRGLMRARFTADDFRSPGNGSLYLEPTQVVALEARRRVRHPTVVWAGEEELPLNGDPSRVRHISLSEKHADPQPKGTRR